MRHYAIYSENGKLIAIGTGCGGVEITEEEYNRLFAEIQEKATLVNSLYNNEISIDAVFEDWREEIQLRVNERIEREALLAEMEQETDEHTETDYQNALEDLGVIFNEENSIE